MKILLAIIIIIIMTCTCECMEACMCRWYRHATLPLVTNASYVLDLNLPSNNVSAIYIILYYRLMIGSVKLTPVSTPWPTAVDSSLSI